MVKEELQNQIDEINGKLDLILEEISVQRQNRESVNDLVDDLAVVGKDAFKNMVTELDHAGVELDTDSLRCLTLRLIRNIGSLGMVMETLESINDLAKDLTPVIKQIGIDGVHKFHELEQKGYFELFMQLGKTFDNLLSKYSIEDIRKLSVNLIPVIDTIMILGDPKVMNKINSAVVSLRDLNPEDIEEYSVWKMIRELNKPEVKRSIGFLMAFIKKTAK
ncbi:MAG: DUF1641 domain-containing protein, partial [Bacteroidales bacterium]|nr:DUF1641 domain-containing protein [Bacteroidales bacterium]